MRHLTQFQTSVINQAAELFKISSNLTSAQKADAVFNHYSEKVIGNIQKELQKQSGNEAQGTNIKLQSQIDNLTESQKQDIKTLLNVDKLTGDTLRSALLKAGAPTAIFSCRFFYRIWGVFGINNYYTCCSNDCTRCYTSICSLYRSNSRTLIYFGSGRIYSSCGNSNNTVVFW